MRIKNKTKEFLYVDNKDKYLKESVSDYSYNLQDFKIDEELIELQAYKPKNRVNKDFFALKR